MGNFFRLSLKGKVIGLVFCFFLMSSLVTGLVIRGTVIPMFERSMAEDAMDIALSVAHIPGIIDNVGRPDGAEAIQPIADGVRKKTGTEFVVVIDTDGIRYSHKVPERIGKRVVGGDEGRSLLGESYVSRAVGTLGPSLRAFAPIYRNGELVGAVLVGILIDRVNAETWRLTTNVLMALALGLVVGIVGATVLADGVKQSMRGFEPEEIDRFLWEREAMLESIKEGILAVDETGKVTLVNGEARRLLGLPDSGVIGRQVDVVVPNSRLPQVLSSGVPEYDREQVSENSRILTNRVPIVCQERTVGAVASFRDMSEVTSMAEELTGVRRYVDALRVRNHEFLNKLQTISGLVQLGEHDRAVAFISETVQSTQSVMSFIARRIKNPSVGGLILGKMGRCRELGIEFRIDEDSYLGPPGRVDSNALVAILGNLLENGMNALMDVSRERRRIYLSLFDESGRIIISVKDTGPGIPENLEEDIFERGFSTKGEGHGGYGLFNVKSLVEAYGGEINLESREGVSTEFLVNLPNGGSRS
ncbi:MULTISPECIES: ATP-binding protein [Dethiosulfovibrio]|uniref:histidine kinase n=2 Tax=Dethiosulfovibrio TaxID=47054 RepID=A0ABS9EUK5_9BACT|nr:MULTISPECIES: sensor histidine kinase [Dethiosulfovibrio]MCF4114991.1 sensor histidine kinase [Dethiosulfovibrio russensis]MCF4143433.1 sensor histidine kinase [Dethiosulfovibrio marinus]MCF4145949.1 sensor histidine kinase [Dethiosulfovibrio acidaminovorans]